MTEKTYPLYLHKKHEERGARFGVFGEWEVPLYYTSILEEHEQVRKRAGLFDISHMGEFVVTGKGAESYLDFLLPRNIKKLPLGKALYSPLLNERGGFVDDIIVYKVSSERFWIIVNAGNVAKDFAWFKTNLSGDVLLTNESDNKGLLAIQGPLALQVVNQLYPSLKLSQLSNYGFIEIEGGMIARTGYTGEDGFEIMIDKSELNHLWDRCFQNPDLKPIGFGARDTLRLEAAMLLYGHDMNEEVNPLEAGIGWTLDFTKTEFVARDILLKIKEQGITRKLIGFEMMDRGIPRQGYPILKSGKKTGEVTSGGVSPTLQKNIGLGYVPIESSAINEEIEILVRDRPQKAKIIPIPFYHRKKSE
ncbi:MAG: glycine cleavage system aminomethyltransferase GcvT [Candidatus Omnitrophica bacterium]|nr:glycine cleavage system aminomethyltransferase GcvT [Candidatus Omnitrophota bacterium]